MSKIVTFTDKSMARMAETAVGSSKARLQEELNRVIGMEIHCDCVTRITTTTKERTGNIASAESRECQLNDKALYDLGLFQGLKYLCLKNAGRSAKKLYPHRWSAGIENLVVENTDMLLSVAPSLDRLVNLKTLAVSLTAGKQLTLPKATKERLTVLSTRYGSDYSFLEGCNALEEISITEGGAVALQTLPKLPQVKRLSVTGYAGMDMSGIEKLPSVEYLNLSNSTVSDIAALAGLKKLQAAGLCNSALFDLAPLAALPLQTLDVSGNMIEDVAALGEIESLVYLDLAHNPIEDISPLAGCTNMELLHLSDTWVSDLSPLFGMKKLQELSVDLRFIKDKRQFRQLSHVATINGQYFVDFMASEKLND
ncbi:MAG: leucine-rich repeat domain-containing protein [Angelakisella sp.]